MYNKDLPPHLLKKKDYCMNAYGLGWYSFFRELEEFAGYESILIDDNRNYILSKFGYFEVSMDMDSMFDIIHGSIDRKDGRFLKDEAEAFFEFYKVLNIFDDIAGDAPVDDEGFRNYCLSHQLWKELEKQARNTLDFFKKNKDLRNKNLQ